MFLYSVDPGVKGCGLALWRDGMLVNAFYVKGPDAFRTADAVVTHCLAFGRGGVLAVEMPQVYRAGLQKGDPNDLIDLAFVVGMISGSLCPTATACYKPREWKGQVPKDIMKKRIEGRLSLGERAGVHSIGAKDHNTWDAVGIGLHHFGRLH